MELKRHNTHSDCYPILLPDLTFPITASKKLVHRSVRVVNYSPKTIQESEQGKLQ